MHTKRASELTARDKVVMDPFRLACWGTVVSKDATEVLVREQRGHERCFAPDTMVTLLGEND